MATHEFQAEIRQLLDILVHNVYSSKDVFLRELLSNATDALEKVRFLAARGETVADPDRELTIDVSVTTDPAPRLTLADTGIGMTEAEVRDNLGTIARSGAARFLESMRTRPAGDAASAGETSPAGDAPPADEAKLIGRFGIGFYSVFMVADRVVLTTRSADPAAAPVRWTSDGTGSYEVTPGDPDQRRGTTIEIHLRPDEARFADADVVRDAIRTHSNFIPFPVRLGGEQVNHTTALWREPPTRVTPDDAEAFYKLLAHGDEAPLATLHTTSDGTVSFSALLFVPPPDPFGLPNPEDDSQVQLYTRRVLIDRHARGLLPPYLRFVRGVVESEDLPLNLSRETLQENTVIARIRSSLTRRMTDRLREIATETPEKYEAIWRAYGPILREAIRDFKEHERLAELIRLPSSTTEGDRLTSLADYVRSMRDKQAGIYYLPVTTREALARDPRAEWFKRHGIELLFLESPIDEIVLQSLRKFQDKPLRSAEQLLPEDVEAFKLTTGLSGSDDAGPAIARLTERLQEILSGRVAEVRTTDRLSQSPVMLRGDEAGMSRSMHRLQKMMGMELPTSLPVFEVNPDHPVVKDLAARVQADAADPLVPRAAEALFQAARLLDADVADPQAAAVAVFELLGTLTGPSATSDTATTGPATPDPDTSLAEPPPT